MIAPKHIPRLVPALLIALWFAGTCLAPLPPSPAQVQIQPAPAEAPKEPPKPLTPEEIERARKAGDANKGRKIPGPEDRAAVVAAVEGGPSVTLDDLLGELIGQYGELHVQELLSAEMVKMEMEARELKVRDQEVEAVIPRVLEQRQWKKGLEELLRTSGMTYDGFVDKIRLQVAMEKMARMDQKRPPNEEVNPILLQLWMQEFRKRYSMETDPRKLPEGVVGRVMGPTRGADVTQEDVIAALFPSLKLRHLEEALKPLVEHRVVQAELLKRGIAVDEDAVAARVAAERRRYEGTFIPWELLLRILGKTVAGERRRFWYENGVKQVFGFAPKAEDLRKHYNADPDLFCRATAEVSHILVQETGPGGSVDWERSEQAARELREKVRTAEEFAAAAREHSKDPATKEKGGDLDPVEKRGSAVVPQALTRAAFESEEGEVGGPVRSDRGWHLFLVRKKNPPRCEDWPFEKVRGEVWVDYEEEVLRKRFLKESRETLEKYFRENQDHFGRATVEAEHILCAAVDEKSGKVDYDRSLEKAKQVMAKIKTGGDFKALAAQWSDDPETKDKGGDVGLFPIKGRIAQDFAKAAFALREGEISQPVRTRQGYHLIRVRKKTPPNLKDYGFEAVKDTVATEYWEDRCRDWIDDLMARTKVDTRPGVLARWTGAE